MIRALILAALAAAVTALYRYAVRFLGGYYEPKGRQPDEPTTGV